MACFTNSFFRTFRKRSRVRSASKRVFRSTLRVESLEQRSLLTSILPVGAPLPDSPVADDVVVDGRIITAENFDTANTGDPSIVRKMPGRTSFQAAGASASGGGAGHDILFGGLGSDGVLESSSGSRHSGGVNALFGDGSVHFVRHSGGVIVAMGDGSVRFISDSIDTPLASAVQGETDADTAAQSGPFQSEYKYVSVRRTVSPSTTDTSDDFGGRQITYTGLEQASGSEASRSFSAFGGFTGGVYVATGDVNGDGLDDIIVSAGAGGHVRVFDGSRTMVSGRITSVVVDPSIDYGDVDLYTNIGIN